MRPSREKTWIKWRWPLYLETARFYAETWPRRRGDMAAPIVVALRVDRHEVSAYMDDRAEPELLIPNAALRGSDVAIVPGLDSAG